MILILASLSRRYTPDSIPPKLSALYIRVQHPFPEVDAFVESSSKEYNLDLLTLERDMKSALSEFISLHEQHQQPQHPIHKEDQAAAPSRRQHLPGESPVLKAIFVGTRSTDPHGATLSSFSPTDGSWPRIMRIHPVLHWHYVQIWAFIRALDLEYCELYDLGYTSLGGTDDTVPNPNLRIDGSEEFRAAWTLESDGEERLGRDK